MGANMSEKEVFEQVKKVIIDLLQINREKIANCKFEILMGTDIYKDLGLDSLEAMDLAAALEKEFKIPIVAEEMVRLTMVKEIVAELIKLMRGV